MAFSKLSRLRDLIRSVNSSFITDPFVVPGIYNYTQYNLGQKNRIHLRIEPDRSGSLIINANRVIHLNPSATIMAYLALEKTNDNLAIQRITHLFNVKTTQAKSDYAQFSDQLNQLISPNGPCPIHDLDLEVIPPFSTRPSAPYRMDLAITYRCNNDCFHCYNDRPRDYPMLNTQAWIEIIDKVWEIGIPQVVFTGGEPTLYEDLPKLVTHAEKLGLVTGLNTNGRRLSSPAYLHSLVEAGLDHVQITLESHIADIHNKMVNSKGAWEQTVAGIRNTLETPLYVMTNTTMLQENIAYLESTLDFLSDLGVPTVGLNALIYAGRGSKVNSGIPDEMLPDLLDMARHKTNINGQRLIWYTPTQYCHFDPMQLELGVKGCTAALYNMCVEPDGAVIPCQSYYSPLGNIRSDSWESMWNHELAISLRERHYIPDKCRQCLLLQECGGGCPLKLQSQVE